MIKATMKTKASPEICTLISDMKRFTAELDEQRQHGTIFNSRQLRSYK
jgi:hypothetical protein